MTGPARRAFTLIELLAAMTIISALVAIAIPRGHAMIERARQARATGDIRTLQAELEGRGSLPSSLVDIDRAGLLDPWGRPYVYFKFPPGPGGGNAPPAGARRDRFLVPVNSTYDLYSVGRDGKSAAPFTAKASHDDVVRASDGSYIGLASRY